MHVGDFPYPLTARRLLELVEQLPEGSALSRAVAGPEDAVWSMERHLLAGVIDELRALQYVIAAGNGAKGLRAPKPIPRPGTRPQSARQKPPSVQDVRARLNERGIEVPDELLRR